MKKNNKLIPGLVTGAIVGIVLGLVVGWLIWGGTYLSTELVCVNGLPPDKNGCCVGETYTDMGDFGFNCCPDAGGDCFPPIK